MLTALALVWFTFIQVRYNEHLVLSDKVSYFMYLELSVITCIWYTFLIIQCLLMLKLWNTSHWHWFDLKINILDFKRGFSWKLSPQFVTCLLKKISNKSRYNFSFSYFYILEYVCSFYQIVLLSLISTLHECRRLREHYKMNEVFKGRGRPWIFTTR